MTTAEVAAAREFLAGLSDERAVQLWRWLSQPDVAAEVPGQLPLVDDGVPG